MTTEIARRLGPEARGAPRECRDWTPRAWPVAGQPRAEDPCEVAIETWACPLDLDAAPQLADNWRERAVRAAAVSMCDPEPPRLREHPCAGDVAWSGQVVEIFPLNIAPEG